MWWLGPMCTARVGVGCSGRRGCTGPRPPDNQMPAVRRRGGPEGWPAEGALASPGQTPADRTGVPPWERARRYPWLPAKSGPACRPVSKIETRFD